MRLVAGLVVALVVGSAAPAAAHADLIASDPAEGAVLSTAPDQIRFEFTEAVTGVSEGVQVFDASGRPIAASSSSSGSVLTVRLDEKVDAGTLVVVWRVISADGHPVSGSLSFSVGSASPSVTRPDVPESTDDVPVTLTLARWLGYVGLLLLVGLVLFTLVVFPATPSAGPARRRLVRTARVAAPITAVVWLLELPLTALYQTGGGPGSVFGAAAWTALTATEYGVTVGVVLGVAATVALMGHGYPRRPRRFAAIAAGIVAVGAPALTGHTRAATPEALVVGADLLHLVAGSVWLGGLVALTLVLPGMTDEDALGGRTLVRFSGVAAGVLAVLGLTGSLQAWRIIGSWGSLLSTGYGQLLLIKLALVLLAVVIAAWNRNVLLPRLQVRTRVRERNDGVTLVVRAAAAEAVLLVVVLLVTGLLVDRNPESTEGVVIGSGASSPQVQTGMLGDYQVEVTLEPLTTGPNTVTIDTRDAAGGAFEGFAAPQVRLASGDLDLGDVPLSSAAPGVYTGEVLVPKPGTWQLQVSLRVTEFENPVQTFEFSVGSG